MPFSRTLERTLALIKPDAVKATKVREILQLTEEAGFTIIDHRRLWLTPAKAEEFYVEHKGKPFFPNLISFMTSGPTHAMVLSKPGAVQGWRELMGPTNTHTARAQQPTSLRALFGTDGTSNACHGSDSPASAAREIKFFFPHLSPQPYATTPEMDTYLERHLNPTLLKGLTELARQKPSSNPQVATEWLGNWLQEHNPNKPRVDLPAASTTLKVPSVKPREVSANA